MAFLEMHYWGEDEKDNDADRDMQLPFKNLADHAISLVFVPFEKPVIHLPFNAINFTYNSIPYTSNLHSNPALFGVFRPPLS